MIVRRSMQESYLSNSYLIADREGGTAVFVDSGAPIEPLLAAADDLAVDVTHVLNTHDHHDHTTYNVELQERFGVPLLGPHNLEDGAQIPFGDGTITALATPGHTTEHVAFLFDEVACCTGDVLFAGSVGGTLGGGPEGFSQLRRSIMEVLLKLPPAVRLYPGHTDDTTVAREWETNPFVRVWRGLDEEGAEPVQVAGNDGTMVLWAGDYDGGNKAWVRFGDGREAIVGGNMVRRSSPA